jgi:hypothetical protein
MKKEADNKDRGMTGKTDRVFKIINIIIFVLILGLGSCMSFYGIFKPKKTSELEKRELKTFPDITLKTVESGAFQKAFREAMDDQFICRDSCVSFKTDIETLAGRKEINEIYIGKNGLLIEKHTDADYDRKQVDRNIKLLSKFVNMASKGIGPDKVHIMLVPDKQMVYTDQIPVYAEPYTIHEYMKEKLYKKVKSSDSIVIDLSETMQESKDNYIYYRTDHHWTSSGAYLAYLAFKDRKAAETGTNDEGNADETESKDDNGMEAPEFRKVTDDFLGTDYNRIHYYKKKDVIERAEIPEADNASAVINDSGDMTLMDSIYDDSALNTADKYNYFLSGNFSAITIKTACRDTEKKDKTLVLIKDSYSNSLVPFLCQDYGTIVMIDLRYANSSVFDYLNELESMDDLLIVYNYDKFMRDTHQYLLQ